MPNAYRFLATTESGTWGRGDRPAAEGGSLGFLRNNSRDGISAIMVVLVTDEDDCSLQSTAGITSNGDADPGCQQHKDKLYDLQRYYDGFRKLRPGREELVVFTAIAGVPVDLVSAKALSQVDFVAEDPSTRNAHYDRILNDPRMQEVIDAGGKLEIQRVPNTRTDLNRGAVQPEIGSNCRGEIGTNKPMGDAACVITLANNSVLNDMFCHEAWGSCVRRCSVNAECPPGWGCDQQPEHAASGGNKGAYCINLACGPDLEP